MDWREARAPEESMARTGERAGPGRTCLGRHPVSRLSSFSTNFPTRKRELQPCTGDAHLTRSLMQMERRAVGLLPLLAFPDYKSQKISDAESGMIDRLA